MLTSLLNEGSCSLLCSITANHARMSLSCQLTVRHIFISCSASIVFIDGSSHYKDNTDRQQSIAYCLIFALAQPTLCDTTWWNNKKNKFLFFVSHSSLRSSLPLYYSYFWKAEFSQYQYLFDLVAGLLKSGNKKAFSSHFTWNRNDAILSENGAI